MPPEILGALNLACRYVNRCADLTGARRLTMTKRNVLRAKVQKHLSRAQKFQEHRDGGQ